MKNNQMWDTSNSEIVVHNEYNNEEEEKEEEEEEEEWMKEWMKNFMRKKRKKNVTEEGRRREERKEKEQGQDRFSLLLYMQKEEKERQVVWTAWIQKEANESSHLVSFQQPKGCTKRIARS